MALSRVKTWIAEILYASDLNAEFNNLLNNALSLISPLTGNLDAGGNKITTLGAPTALADGMRLGDSISNLGIYYTTAGTEPTYTLTPSPAITAYAAGQWFLIKVHSTNASGDATLNVSAIGAKAWYNSHAKPLLSNELQQNALLLVAYDGTQFRTISMLTQQSELTETKTAATASTLDFSLPSGYKLADFELYNITGLTAGQQLHMRVSIAASFQTGASYNYNLTSAKNGGISQGRSTGQATIPISVAANTASGYGLVGTVKLSQWTETANYKVLRSRVHGLQNAGGFEEIIDTDGYWGGATSAIDQIRFLTTSGTFSGSVTARYRGI